MTPPARIQQIDTDQFRLLAPDAASVYGAAMHRSPEVVVQRQDIIAVHVSYKGFVSAGAFDIDELVGFGYGYRGAPGQWWHDDVRTALTAAAGKRTAEHWLGDSFEIAEVHVRPEYQRRGIGRAMLLRLTEAAEQRTALLSTQDLPSPARHLYRSLGFTDLLTNFCFPCGGPPYAVMGAELPLAASGPRLPPPSPSRW